MMSNPVVVLTFHKSITIMFIIDYYELWMSKMEKTFRNLISTHDDQSEIYIIITISSITSDVEKFWIKIVELDLYGLMINVQDHATKTGPTQNRNPVSENDSMIFCSRDRSASGIKK